MSLSLVCLDVGNADCIIVNERSEQEGVAVVDVPRFGRLRAWLLDHGLRRLDHLIVTHDHYDHFQGITSLQQFVAAWASEGGTVGCVVLPRDLLRRARVRLRDLQARDPAGRRTLSLQAALDDLIDRIKKGSLKLHTVEEGQPDLARYGPTVITAIHPSVLDLEDPPVATRPENPTSLVLRVGRESFTAVLLADLEGWGLQSLLERAIARPPDWLRCNVVKIPHHGGWPSASEQLQELLRRIDPELAILSVGSKNPHGHVRPELFRALVHLRGSARLTQFVCTELTRTCKQQVSSREAAGRQGLAAREPCAGDIEVVVESDIPWRLARSADHQRTVEGVPFAACSVRASL